MTIQDITDKYAVGSIRPHYPWVFNHVLQFIEIDFAYDDDREAEQNHVDYFEKYKSRLKNEIRDWNRLKALKKPLQRKKQNLFL